MNYKVVGGTPEGHDLLDEAYANVSRVKWKPRIVAMAIPTTIDGFTFSRWIAVKTDGKLLIVECSWNEQEKDIDCVVKQLTY